MDIGDAAGRAYRRAKDLKLYYFLIPVLAGLAATSAPRFTLVGVFMFVVVAAALAANFYEFSGLGVELATFATVSTALMFEPAVSAALAFVYIVIQMFAGGNTGIYIFWVIPSYVAAGFIISVLEPSSLVQAGSISAAVLQSIFVVFTAIFSRGYVGIFVRFVALNIIFNIVLFAAFGPLISSYVGL